MCNNLTCNCGHYETNHDDKRQPVCWRCDGEKKIYIGTTELTCPVCNGVGYNYLVNKET